MHDAVLVGIRQCSAHPFDQVNRFRIRHAVITAIGIEKDVERRPFQQLHADENGVARAIEIVDRDDVRVSEPLLAARLTLQHDEGIVALLEILPQNLDRDIGVTIARFDLEQVATLVHDAHAADAEDLVEDEAIAQSSAERNVRTPDWSSDRWEDYSAC